MQQPAEFDSPIDSPLRLDMQPATRQHTSGSDSEVKSHQLNHYFRIRNENLDRTIPQVRPGQAIREDPISDVKGLADLALGRVISWASKYPIMNVADDTASRAVWVTLYSANAFPDGPLDLVVDCSQLLMSIFAYDDIMDGLMGERTYGELQELSNICGSMPDASAGVNQATSVSSLDRQVIDAYYSCFQKISARPSIDKSDDYMKEQWRCCTEAMLQEARWRLGIDRPPALKEYLENGTYSLFAPAVYAAGIVMSDLAPVGKEDLQAWDNAARKSSFALRLCNDLRSEERESREGGPNAVWLLVADGLPRQEAIINISSAVDKALEDMEGAIKDLPKHLMGMGASLRRSTRFTCSWYLTRDTHGLTRAELHSLASER